MSRRRARSSAQCSPRYRIDRRLFGTRIIEFMRAVSAMSIMHLPRFMHSSKDRALRGGHSARCAVKNGANDPPRPTTQPFYGSEQRLCTLLYVTLEDRFTSIRDLGLSQQRGTFSNFLRKYIHSRLYRFVYRNLKPHKRKMYTRKESIRFVKNVFTFKSSM